jgi:hypothetical protein
VVTGSGNFVAGRLNCIIAAADDSILGGGNNEIAGPGTPLVSYSTISGGQFNQAGANFVSILGGQSIGEYTGVSP